MNYSPLTSPGEIRLLDLKQQDDISAPVVLEMRHINISNAHEITGNVQVHATSDEDSAYSALSYVWGEPGDSRSIWVNGVEVPVTANLESALRHMQTRGATLWVDALCINQDDLEEKVAQILLMKAIYSCADEVIIWFGEERPITTALAMNFLDQHVTQLGPSQYTLELDGTRENPTVAAAWDAVGQDLLKRPWWRRIWVIQEIGLAKRAMVICGQLTLNWNKLVIATQYARDHGLPIFYKSAAELARGDVFQENSKAKSEYRLRLALGNDIPLHELLINNLSCFATNPRDMVFGLLGLATDVEDAPELHTDYIKSVEDVYSDFFKWHVRKYRTLDIMCASKHPKNHLELPSWVPDWSNLRDHVSTLLPPLAPDAFEDGRYFYQACGSLPPLVTFQDGGRMRLLGIYVDTIATLGDPCLRIEDYMNEISRWRGIVMDTGPEKEQGRPREYVGGGSLLDAFNRTITADRTRSGHRAQPGQRGLEPAIRRAMGLDYGIPDSYRQGYNLTPEEREKLWVADTLQAIALVSMRRRLLVTGEGYLGLGPVDAQVGDKVYVLLGCSVPVVLRECEDYWRFVGESFITGIMDGEIIDKLREQMSEEEESPTVQETMTEKYMLEEIFLR